LCIVGVYEHGKTVCNFGIQCITPCGDSDLPECTCRCR
jgi:hypothetical protein